MDSQRNSTCVNDSQREMPWLSVSEAPKEVRPEILDACKDALQALNLCINLSCMSDEALSDALGIDKGHWSRIRKGRAHFPTRKRQRLMELCGNILPLQYEAKAMGYALTPISKDEQIKALERQLAEIRRAA